MTLTRYFLLIPFAIITLGKKIFHYDLENLISRMKFWMAKISIGKIFSWN